MDREDLQTLANLRVKETKALIDKGCYNGAFYLLGYSLECALKSCIAKQFREHEFPDKKLVNDSYTHDLEKLLNLSGLKDEFENSKNENPEFDSNWAIIKDWNENKRYQHDISKIEALDFYEAVNNKKTGLLLWLKKFW